MSDAIANWQWLIPLARRDEAVVLSTPQTAAASHITEGFARTRYFDPTSDGMDLALFTAAWTAEFAEGSLDCIAAPDVDRYLRGWPPAVEMLSVVRRSLRRGSGCYVVAEAIRIGNRTTRFAGLAPSRHEQYLRRAGFRPRARYYIVNTPALPLHLLPIDRMALIAWERATEDDGIWSFLRRLLIRVGLHALLFRYRLIIVTA